MTKKKHPKKYRCLTCKKALSEKDIWSGIGGFGIMASVPNGVFCSHECEIKFTGIEFGDD